MANETEAEAGCAYLSEHIKTWSQKYVTSVKFQYQEEQKKSFHYLATFSRPLPQKPVPEAEARVYFIVAWPTIQFLRKKIDFLEAKYLCKKNKILLEVIKMDTSSKHPIIFFFENQNMKYTLNGVLKGKSCEKIIDRIIDCKLQVRNMYSQNFSDDVSKFQEPRFAAINAILEKDRQECAVLGLEILASHSEADSHTHRNIGLLTHLPNTTYECCKGTVIHTAEICEKHVNEESPDRYKDLTPRMLFEVEPEKLPLKILLRKIFFAADENTLGFLSHQEISNIIQNAPLGLTRWDLLILLQHKEEDPNGVIFYQDFLQKAPDIIENLRKRRKLANERLNHPPVSEEAVQQCFRDDIDEICRVTKETLESSQAYSRENGKISRWEFKNCLLSRRERLSIQEVNFLMQLVPTDDNNCIDTRIFSKLMEILRCEAINNAVDENDAEQIRIELCDSLIKQGYNEQAGIPIWALRDLLNKSSLCLSRMHIHALLCSMTIDSSGCVLYRDFLHIAIGKIPLLFDRRMFSSIANRIALEKCEAAAKAELEELQGLTAGGKVRRKQTLALKKAKIMGVPKVDTFSGSASKKDIANSTKGQKDEDEQDQPPDFESVEKTLIHLFTVMDDKGRGTLSIPAFITTMLFWNSPNPFQKAQNENSIKMCDVNTTETPNEKSPFEIYSVNQAKVFSNRHPIMSSVSGASTAAAVAAAARYADVVASCRLTKAEVTGFIGEVEIVNGNEISYHDHVKTWIPIIFELRRNRLFPILLELHRGE